ncbi:hypothetical protein JCM10450v2_005302 [Rhodotorula kratochvilovae]
MDTARTTALEAAPSADRPHDDDGRVQLDLVKGPYQHRHSLASSVHLLLSTTALLLRIPFHLLYHYVFFRFRSPLVQELGRPPIAEVAALLVRHLFLKAYLAPGRLAFSLALPNKWVKTVEVGAVRANWIAPPDGSSRKDDDLILYWIHGGGFFHDTAGACQGAFVELTKMLNKRGVKFSVFHLHYHLAPEFIYPSQQIEVLAGYHYLVNELGVPESKITIGGDSAGGNLVAGFLLQLARPNPRTKVPKALGPTPGKPGSALLVSPFIDLASHAPSRTAPYYADFIDDGGVFHGSLSYVGAVHPYPPSLEGWRRSPSWNPLRWFGNDVAAEAPPKGVVDFTAGVEDAESGDGLALLASPYVNPHPGVVKDLSWYKEALPADGKTLVTWGGKEIFADDITLFVDALKEAGVAPLELVKPLAVHDWPLFDAIVPTNSRHKNGGEQSKWDYGVRKIADFLEARATEAEGV